MLQQHQKIARHLEGKRCPGSKLGENHEGDQGQVKMRMEYQEKQAPLVKKQ